MKLLSITSLQNEKLKFLTSLRLKKNRKIYGCFMLEGVQAILTAHALGKNIKQIFYTNRAKDTAAFSKLVAGHKTSFLINDKLAQKISKRDNPLNSFAIVETWGMGIEHLSPKTNAIYLAIDRVRDPGNLGTMVRSLIGFGGKGIILIGDSVDFFSPEVARASMGAISHAELYQCNEDEFLSWHKQHQNQWHITATIPKGGSDCRTLPYKRPQILLFGNEQQGISARLLHIADQHATITMEGDIESLNLAMAGTIMGFLAMQKI
ncbi:MAG: TrmH family RNA methyltransferase [Alphaproteobacteria bacterium]